MRFKSMMCLLLISIPLLAFNFEGGYAMSYTNKTANYDLPLYVGSDKPSYVNDWNPAMNTLDSKIKGNSDGIATTNADVDALEKRVKALEEQVVPEGSKMVCIGDSWLAGYSSVATYTNWGEHLASMLNVTGYYYCDGGSGYGRAGNGGKSFNDFVNDAVAAGHSDADLVVIMGGVNDLDSSAQTVATLQSKTTTLIQNARAKFPKAVIWCFIMPLGAGKMCPNTSDRIYAISKGIDLAACSKVYYDTGCWTWVYDDPNLTDDIFHPNGNGYKVVATKALCRMNGGDPTVYTYNCKSQVTTKNGSSVGVFTRCWDKMYLYLSNTSGGSANTGLADWPSKYNGGPFFGIFLAGDTGDMHNFSLSNGVTATYTDWSQCYLNTVYTLNDNR